MVCMAAMIGVVALGALQGIALAIGLAMLVLLVRSSRPADGVLGRVPGARILRTRGSRRREDGARDWCSIASTRR